MIHVVNKGKTGEREVADMLNFIIYKSMKELGYEEAECLKGMCTIQRNQEQTAIGGADLVHCYGLAIEVKRQEQLSVNTWWKQCVASADRKSEVPILIYRQNNKPWRVRTYSWINLPNGQQMRGVGEFDIDTFKEWFGHWVKFNLQNN